MPTHANLTHLKPLSLDGWFRPTNPELLQRVEQIIPSLGALRWNLRANQAEYIRRGVIVFVSGRTLIHAERFVEAALEIGAQRAAERLAKAA